MFLEIKTGTLLLESGKAEPKEKSITFHPKAVMLTTMHKNEHIHVQIRFIGKEEYRKVALLMH